MTQHAIQRAKERLGIDVTLEDLSAAVASLGTSPRAVLVCRQGGGKQVWIAPLRGVMAGMVVNVRDGAVVTVMEPYSATRPGLRGEFTGQSRRAQKRRGAWRRQWTRSLEADDAGA